MDGSRLYLDYNASAPLRPEAREAMVAALAEAGNASSVHAEGRAARKRIEDARRAIADLVGGDPRRVTFTSGGSEANATVLTPDWTFNGRPHRAAALLVSAGEHPSVLAGGRFGPADIHEIPLDSDGVVRLDVLGRMLEPLAADGLRPLVSVMLANNETGVIQPVADIARLVHDAGGLVHTDAVQAAGRIALDLASLGVDVLTLSAHKIGGPQGVGAVVRAHDDIVFAPLIAGGGQEKRLRAGTESVAAIAGFGAAAAVARDDLALAAMWEGWRDGLARTISDCGPTAVVFGVGTSRLPQTLCIGIEGIAAETLVIALDLEGVSVSSGAACSSGKVAPSHVLAAMGVPVEVARTAIRLSLGWQSDERSLDLFAKRWVRVLEHVAPGHIRAA
ncbi:MAG: cysteine desulfurase [Bauldia sp.]|nr:cysteine desulfurase [Bauldia sp.]